MISESIILAGGLGTRLRSAVPDLPKCMAPVNGKPFLSYLVDYYSKQGVDRFIFSLGYMHDHIERFLEKKFKEESLSGKNYSISLEDEPLGTGGAVQKACSIADAGQLLILNGDTFFAVDVPLLSAFHTSHMSACSLCLKPMMNSDRYGVVEIDEHQRIHSFKEKKWYASGLINGGVYALDKQAFLSKKLPQKFSFEKEYLGEFYSSQHMFGNVQDEYFIDIGIPDDYLRAQTELLQNC